MARCHGCGGEGLPEDKYCSHCGLVLSAGPPKSFWHTLFDWSMRDFITPKIIRLVFPGAVLFFAAGLLGWIAGSVASARSLGFIPILATLVLAPVVFLCGVVCLRINLEIIAAFFNMAADLKEIKAAAKTGPESGAAK